MKSAEGSYQTVVCDPDTRGFELSGAALEPVWRNGELLRRQNFDEIRALSREASEKLQKRVF
ncbi:MAG: hypothetical protein ING19_12890 [Azospirillum sp.]|nr:hypothetical protein [Azospirillum sp.]